MTLNTGCANPSCFCQTPDPTCSLWCGTRDIPSGVRCLCRHDHCGERRVRSGRTDAETARPLAMRPRTLA
jgi:hypothetical protein